MIDLFVDVKNRRSCSIQVYYTRFNGIRHRDKSSDNSTRGSRDVTSSVSVTGSKTKIRATPRLWKFTIIEQYLNWLEVSLRSLLLFLYRMLWRSIKKICKNIYFVYVLHLLFKREARHKYFYVYICTYIYK